MKVLGKYDVVREISQKTGVPQRIAGQVLEAFVNVVEENLAAGNAVKILGFGKFYVIDRGERKGRNPQTGEEIVIPATRIPRFKPYRNLKQAVKK